MTRINVIPPEQLCDKHLMAEFRELTRIPNQVQSGKLRPHYPDAPATYTLGKGHVKFFVDKLGFLAERYQQLYAECRFRGFNVTYIFPAMDPTDQAYTPTQEASHINLLRIIERLPTSPRWTRRDPPHWYHKEH